MDKFEFFLDSRRLKAIEEDIETVTTKLRRQNEVCLTFIL